MKKFVLFILTLALSAGLCVCAFAADTKFDTLFDMLDSWEENGYPNYVNYVFRTKDNYPVTIVLVKGSNVTKEDIQRNYKETHDFDLISDAPYSYNELEKVRDEIASDYIKTKMNGSYSKVEECYVGWKTESDVVYGFGDSQYEARVVVWVPQAELNEMTTVLTQKYGDMVYVEAYAEQDGLRYYLTAPATTTTAPETSNSQSTPVIVNGDKTSKDNTSNDNKEPENCESNEDIENADVDLNKDNTQNTEKTPTTVYYIIIAVVVLLAGVLVLTKSKK